MTNFTAYARWMRSAGLGTRTIQSRINFARARHTEWGTWNRGSADLADWLDQHTGWTRTTYDSHLRSLYRWLTEVGQLGGDPMLLLRRPPQPRSRPRPLTRSERGMSIMAAAGDLRAHLLLGLLGGLRAGEIARFRGEHITEVGLRIPEGKGGTDVTIPTHPDLWVLAQQYPRWGFWFPSYVNVGQPVTSCTVSRRVTRHFEPPQVLGRSYTGSGSRLRAA